MRVRPRTTGWLVVSLFCVGLTVPGCAAGPRPTDTPPSLPPTRALVAWSNTVCENTATVDDLPSQIDSVNADAADPGKANLIDSDVTSYLTVVRSDVDDTTKSLKTLTGSGIQAADRYVADVLNMLSGIKAQLPQPDDPAFTALSTAAKLAKARQVATAIAAIKPHGPILTSLVANNPILLVSHDLAPNCVPTRQPAQPATSAATRTLVIWSDTMCTSMKSVDALAKNPLDDPMTKDSRFGMFVGPMLAQYISGAATQLSEIEQRLAPLAPTGVKQADGYWASLLSALNTVLPKLPQTNEGNLDSLPVDQLTAETAQVAGALATIKPTGPDLPAIVAHDATLTTAYNLAPNCVPITHGGSASTTAAASLPSASDGTDVRTCRAGKCQVRVSGSVDITVSGVKFSVLVGPTGVTIIDNSGYVALGADGTGSFSQADGKTINVHVIGLTSTAAVLDISTA